MTNAFGFTCLATSIIILSVATMITSKKIAILDEKIKVLGRFVQKNV